MKNPFFIIELKADFSLDDCINFLNSVTEKGNKLFRNLFVALPFFRLREITSAFPDSGITFGTALLNNCDPDSFTASVASKMVKDAGGHFTLIGTRYERNHLHVTDLQLKNKIKEAKASQLKIIYCVNGDDEETILKQLELLKDLEDPHPILIYELSFHHFTSYLPNETELQEAFGLIQKAIDQPCTLLVALPADLIGFSTLIEGLPFDGAFFIRSGTYPHVIHDETVKLVHVYSTEQQEV